MSGPPSGSRVASGSASAARRVPPPRIDFVSFCADRQSRALHLGRPASGTVGGKASLATPDGSGRRPAATPRGRNCAKRAPGCVALKLDTRAPRRRSSEFAHADDQVLDDAAAIVTARSPRATSCRCRRAPPKHRLGASNVDPASSFVSCSPATSPCSTSRTADPVCSLFHGLSREPFEEEGSGNLAPACGCHVGCRPRLLDSSAPQRRLAVRPLVEVDIQRSAKCQPSTRGETT